MPGARRGGRVARHRNRSGLPWRSGVHATPPATFQTWRTNLLDLTYDYSARDTWGGIENPWQLGDTWPGELVIGQPFWPEGSGGSLASGASGAYDTHWATYGTNLVAAGRPNLLTSLALEFNGDWFEWSATSAADFIGCYQRIVTAVRSTAPQARFAWVMNAHASQNPPSGHAMDAYPGDSYVDVIGIDCYDHFPKSMNQTAFDNQAAAEHGIGWALGQAQSHGKPLMVPEWGVDGASETADWGGDNAFYVQAMQAWFRANAAYLYGEMYFDWDPAGISPQAVTDGAIAHPNARAAYLAGLTP